MAKNGRQNYDWDAIKRRYVTSELSLNGLSEETGIRRRTLSERSRKDGWVAARKQYREQVATRTTSKLATKVADKKSDLLARVLVGADISADKIVEVLSSGKPLKPTEMEHYMNCLETIERMARSIQGILTVAQERKLKIEEERLELEKKRTEQSAVDKDVVIRIEGYEKEWSE